MSTVALKDSVVGLIVTATVSISLAEINSIIAVIAGVGGVIYIGVRIRNGILDTKIKKQKLKEYENDNS